MARTRNIKPGFFMNEELAELPCEARLLFIGLWTLADREGRLEDRPRKIRAAIFPYEDWDVDTLLGLLEGKNFLKRYSIKGQCCIQISNFVKHQKPHPNEAGSEVPAQDEDECGGPDGGEEPRASREKAGLSHEEAGLSHEEAGLSHEMQESGSALTRTRREREAPSSGSSVLGKDIRMERQEEEKGDKGDPTAQAQRTLRIRGQDAESAVKLVFDYWRERTAHLDAKLTREREMKIRGRLGEGYSVEQLKEAVEGCRGSRFHQGENDGGRRYDDMTLICRSGSKVEQFIEMRREGPDERKPGKRSNVDKIMEGLELVRSRVAQSGDTSDDNQQGESCLLAAGIRAG